MLAGSQNSLSLPLYQEPRRKHLANKHVEKFYAMGMMHLTQSKSHILLWESAEQG